MKLLRYETLTLWNSDVMELLRYVMLHQVPFTYVILRFVAAPRKRQAILNWIRTFTGLVPIPVPIIPYGAV
jgi:hypothetical protein